MNRKLKLRSTLVIFILLGITIFSLVPFYWMISTSLKGARALMAIPIQWIPEQVTFESYIRVLTELPFLKSTLNSLIVTLGSTTLTLASASLAAFVFAKYNFKYKNVLFIMFLTSMMIPIQVTGIPIFIILSKLGLTNSFMGVILPSIYNVFAIFLLRQYMRNISNDFIEAAYMDGANMFQVFWKIVLPMSIIPLATLFVINFMNYWNDYFWPLIILTDPDKVTLPVLLSKLNTQYNTEYNTLMAGSLVSMVPILVVYMFAQKYFIRGIQEGGIK